jgi:urease accessory protein
MITTMDLDDGALLRLLSWLSPGFPTGGFSYSHGLEFAVEAGLVRDRAGLAGWVGAVIEHGAGRSDGILFAAAHRAVTADDEAAFLWAVERGDVQRGSAELALESSAQGQAFLATVRAAWPLPGLERWIGLIRATGRAPAHGVAVALAAALAGIALQPALAGFLHALAATLVSAGVRLVPLGQTDGQRVLAALEPLVLAAARRVPDLAREDIGGRASVIEWASLCHETQYTRLFRS